MNRRLVYLACGAAVAVLAVLRAAAAAQQGEPGAEQQAGGGSAGSLGERFADFMDEVRELMAEREVELRTTLGLDGTHDLVDAQLAATRGAVR